MWIFKQRSGEIWHDGILILKRAYAGYGDGKNNPEMQGVRGKRPEPSGPLPCGLFIIGPPTDVDGGPHGPFVLPLTPDPENEMFGRSGFLIHADSIKEPGTASEGCICAPITIRRMIATSGDTLLKVTSGDENGT